jgi:hypothetical protein
MQHRHAFDSLNDPLITIEHEGVFGVDAAPASPSIEMRFNQLFAEERRAFGHAWQI